jgi:hypothetical protein
MQLLIQRNQGTTRIRFKPIFILWAKVELTTEEMALVQQYKVTNHVLVEGNVMRDLARSTRWAFLIAVVSMIFVVGRSNATLYASFQVFFLAYGLSMYIIYNRICERILVGDMIEGRTFKLKSVQMLMLKEKDIIAMSDIFLQLLEAMKTWGNRMIVNIELHEPPTFQVIEDTHEVS